MRIFAVVPRREGVNCQTTISVHACVREFEHERTFIIFIVASCMKENYRIIRRRQFLTKLADVGKNTYCNIY